MYYVTIDGGTTNTRLSLVKDGAVLGTRRLAVGSNGTLSREELTERLHAQLTALLAEHGVPAEGLSAILASGMITSEYGLCPLSHAVAPVGIAELHRAMHTVSIPALAPIPVTFLRGVRTENDMMRGEETELYGLPATRGALVVLPGSHSKLVRLDGKGNIQEITTMMTGEMLAALCSHTILRGAVSLDTDTLCKEALLAGYRAADGEGLNRALFLIRVMQVSESATETERYSFFLGAVLSAEINAILASDAPVIEVGGHAALREATVSLISMLGDSRARAFTDEEVALSTVRGAIRIYENKD